MVSRASYDRKEGIKERRDQPQWLAGPVEEGRQEGEVRGGGTSHNGKPGLNQERDNQRRDLPQ